MAMLLPVANLLHFAYVDQTADREKFAVVIAPQNAKRDTAIAALLPNIEKTEIVGGSGYSIGSYYSKDYADVKCSQYRSLGVLTIGISREAPIPGV